MESGRTRVSKMTNTKLHIMQKRSWNFLHQNIGQNNNTGFEETFNSYGIIRLCAILMNVALRLSLFNLRTLKLPISWRKKYSIPQNVFLCNRRESWCARLSQTLPSQSFLCGFNCSTFPTDLGKMRRHLCPLLRSFNARLRLCLSACLPAHLSVCLFACLSIWLSVRQCMSVRLCVCVCACQFVCLCQSVGQSVSWSVSQLVNQPVGQSVGQSFSWSVSQSVSWPIGQSIV
jgi:hypothetical protein